MIMNPAFCSQGVPGSAEAYPVAFCLGRGGRMLKNIEKKILGG